MRADEVRSIAASVVAAVGAGDRIVVTPGDVRETWTAWFAGDEATARALRTRLREVAPDVASSVTWIGLPQLPDDGDIDIDVLPRLARSLGPSRPDTALEQIVAVAWQEVLGAHVDSVDDDFFAIGGHSLLAADIAARLDQIVSVDVPLTIVFDHPTIREQAAWLGGVAHAGPPVAASGPAAFVVISPRPLDRRAIDAAGTRHGVTSPLVEIDLGTLRGGARRAAWRDAIAELVRQIAETAPWRATQIRFSATRTLAAIAFDGHRFDAASARRWLHEVHATADLARWWPPRPLAPSAALDGAPDVIASWHGFRIAAPRARALVELGRQQGATPLATVVAAVAVAVGRRSHRDDVAVAISASLRSSELRGALGALTTTTTIAISFTGQPSFLDILDRTSTAICRAWAAAAGAIAPIETRAADVSVELDVDRSPREAWRRAAGAVPLAFAMSINPRGVLAGRVGFDDHDVTADEADAITGELEAVVAEVIADPAKTLVRAGDERRMPAVVVDAPAFGEPLVLSHAQERLWFIESLTPGTVANHLQRVYRIEGPLDAGALARAIAAMMARHEALRTVFRTVDAQPRQLVARAMPIDHAGDTADDDAAVNALATTDYARTFTLDTGPLWRTRLVRVRDGDHRLIVTMHHLIIDAVSFMVWQREIAEHYYAEAAHTTPRLAPIGTTVAAIAGWERSPAGQQRIARDLAYWLDRLDGATPLDLPLDFRRPPIDGLGRHDAARFLSPDGSAEIRALGRRSGTTLSVTLIAAAAAFLARHTGQDDLVCIVPASRRDDPGRKSMIGLLLNLLPLRLRLSGDPTFAELIARTNRALREAMAHAEAPFERIVAGLGLPREPGRQPMFDVVLNMIPGAERLWWGETRVTPEAMTSSAQPCDLVIGAHSRPRGFLGLTVRGRADVFAVDTIRRMAARFETLALAAVAAPSTRLSALPIMPDDERALAVDMWNATAMPVSHVSNVDDVSVASQLAWFERELPWRLGDVAYVAAPACGAWAHAGPRAAGVPVVVATPAEMADPRLMIAAIDRERATRLVVVPSLLQAMLAIGGWPSVSLVIATGETLAPAVVDRFYAARPDCRLVEVYGASAAGGPIAAGEVRPDARARRVPVGKPIVNRRVYVVDTAERIMPIGVPGELYASGLGVGDGVAMWRSGDRGRWRHDGVLEVHGRIDSELRIRGVRVDPADVEAAILAHPSVAAAAVVGGKTELDGEVRLAAYVVPAPDGRVDARELRRFLRAKLPDTLIPTSLVAIDALPLGPTGKLDRHALPIPQPTAIDSRPPQTPVEHAVAHAWEQLLGKVVGAEDDFFATGGRSLVAAQLGARLSERFDVEIPLAVLFEHPTVAMQAAWLETAVLATPHGRIPSAGSGPAPLGFAQERLAFAQLMSPKTPAPKIRATLQIRGALDRERLLAAMRAVAARQPALRTVFGPDSQRVVRELPRDHTDDDLRALSEADRSAAILRHLHDERMRPFDLAAGPPWRSRLVRTADDSHLLMVTFHHYVADGVSAQLWVDEVDACYSGATDTLSAIAISPADVAAWQRGLVDGPYWDIARRYWRDTLAGATALDLPLVAPRASWSIDATGAMIESLSAADTDELAELARRERTTLFAVLLAAAGVLFHGIANKTDLVIGTIAAGRDRPEVENLIGLFLNPLPLRLDVSGDPEVRELVRRADRTTRGALAHSDLPFERIVADANPDRRPFRQPLFDVVLNHHPPGRPPHIGQLDVSYQRGRTAPIAPYELMIRTITRGRELVVQLDYQRERFADATIAEWYRSFLSLLHALPAHPTRRISEL